MKYVFVIIALIIFLLIAASCQNTEYTEYHKNGKIKKQYKRSGALSWSDNKQISLEAHGL